MRVSDKESEGEGAIKAVRYAIEAPNQTAEGVQELIWQTPREASAAWVRLGMER